MEMPNTYFDLFLGYTVIWAILAVFIFRMVRSQTKAMHEIEALKQEIDAHAERAPELRQVNQ